MKRKAFKGTKIRPKIGGEKYRSEVTIVPALTLLIHHQYSGVGGNEEKVL